MQQIVSGLRFHTSEGAGPVGEIEVNATYLRVGEKDPTSRISFNRQM